MPHCFDSAAGLQNGNQKIAKKLKFSGHLPFWQQGQSLPQHSSFMLVSIARPLGSAGPSRLAQKRADSPLDKHGLGIDLIEIAAVVIIVVVLVQAVLRPELDGI